ncbi:replication endonuclease [Psychromonas sp. SR45-3]|uniref:replication endonuclease n=1 Tax=Psychromonas sp. SR45-3 TaxID=2760930 RepID=UPI0015FD706F|nr:replication endonuclease [Psychromonas sp. SR45-3]MBB1272548.1 replication endonuclease [Psychromonas sp. SR45-3]
MNTTEILKTPRAKHLQSLDDKSYFDEVYPADKTAGDRHINLEKKEVDTTGPSVDGLWDKFNPTIPTAKQAEKKAKEKKDKIFRAEPFQVLKNAHVGTQGLWDADKKWACNLLHSALPQDLAISIFGQYVKKWESVMLGKQANPTANKGVNKANIWLRHRIKMVMRAVAKFPVSLNELKHDGLRKQQAALWSDKCRTNVVDGAEQGQSWIDVADMLQKIAAEWKFVAKASAVSLERIEGESDAEFNEREKEAEAGFVIARLVDADWWERKIDTAYRQFCEHCQILNGRVRHGVSVYLSDAGLKDCRARKNANTLALSKMVARNEQTGEEIEMLDIVKGSMANPAIRRHELMVRMRGFEDLAQENKLMGGFFTITTPSRFHAYMKVKNNNKTWSVENDKYDGANPKSAQQYLSKVWAKARAKLKRMDVNMFGFRVCEPHHDGTPHWHALFFFKPEHEQIIKFVLSDYFTQADREELNVNNLDFALWNKAIKDDIQTDDLFANELFEEESNHIFSVSKRIAARVDYKKIDPAKGSATGYIAKYIAKNIDGYKMADDEETGTPADKTAEAVCGWASLWRIRQFQQIGGAPVSVWRELRRLDQTEQELADKKAEKEARDLAAELGEKYVSNKPVQSLIDLQKHKDAMEVARISANSNNWGMYIHAMGGLFCARADHPIKMAYKTVGNQYGEVVKKLKGIATFAKTMITHVDGWVIAKKQGSEAVLEKEAQLPWSSVNNCTGSMERSPETELDVIEQFKKLGVELDPALLVPAMAGAQILTGDGRKASLINTDLGLQMRVRELEDASSVGWEQW